MEVQRNSVYTSAHPLRLQESSSMPVLTVGKAQFRFSVGPWNLHPGADPFGPAVRTEFSWERKLEIFKKIGFDAIQFHDDDVCPADLNPAETSARVKAVRKQLKDLGLAA